MPAALHVHDLAATRAGLAVPDGGIAPDDHGFSASVRIHGDHVEEDLRGAGGRRSTRGGGTGTSSAIEGEVMGRLQREGFVVDDQRALVARAASRDVAAREEPERPRGDEFLKFVAGRARGCGARLGVRSGSGQFVPSRGHL